MQTKKVDSEIEKLYKKIGRNVANNREKKGLTQIELAQAIGHTSTSIISNGEIANGKHFNLEHLYKIAKALEIDICELIKE